MGMVGAGCALAGLLPHRLAYESGVHHFHTSAANSMTTLPIGIDLVFCFDGRRYARHLVIELHFARNLLPQTGHQVPSFFAPPPLLK